MQYFFSPIPCGLKINGEYKGELTLEPKGTHLKSSDFIEIIPFSDFVPVCFLFKNPPSQICRLTSHLGDFIYPISFKPLPLGYEEIFSFTNKDINLKIICDGSCKITLSSSGYFKSFSLPVKPTKHQVLFAENGYIGLLIELNRPSLYLFNTENGNKELFYQADRFIYREGKIKAITNLPTILRHQITACFFEQEKQTSIDRLKSPDELTLLQFKYAFLECCCINDSIKDFISEDIEPLSLTRFIGSFDYILPPLSSDYDFSLVGKDLRFIKIEIKNNKICNVIID